MDDSERSPALNTLASKGVRRIRRLAVAAGASVAVALTAAFATASHAAEEPASVWPDKVVTIEELRPLSALKLKVPKLVAKGEVLGPSTLRVHVDTTSSVVNAVLLDSCGNGDLDESAIHAMRAMKFSPYMFGGVPTEVSLVVPIQVPKRFGRAR